MSKFRANVLLVIAFVLFVAQLVSQTTMRDYVFDCRLYTDGSDHVELFEVEGHIVTTSSMPSDKIMDKVKGIGEKLFKKGSVCELR